VSPLVALSADARAGSCDTVAGVETAPIALTQTNWNQFVTIPKFDPAQGSLCLVVVRISASFQAAVIAQNLSNHPTMMTATITDKVTVQSANPPINFMREEAIPNDVQTVPALGSGLWELNRPTYTEEITYSGAGLSDFIGAGEAFSPKVSGDGSFKVGTSSGNARVKGTVLAGAEIKVTYYTPEPGSLGLLAFGLLLVSRRSRRRR